MNLVGGGVVNDKIYFVDKKEKCLGTYHPLLNRMYLHNSTHVASFMQISQQNKTEADPGIVGRGSAWDPP